MKTISAIALTAALIILFGCEQDTEPNNTTNQVVIISFSPDSVQVGEEVTIKGQYFDPAVANNQVSVNGTAGTVLQATDSTIRFKVNAGTTTGKITVVSGGQTAVTTTNLIIYVIPWVQKANFPTLLISGTSDLNGLAMTFNSATAGYVYKSKKLWHYDPVSNAWTAKADLPSNKFHNNGLCFTIGNKAYIGLGSSGIGGTLSSMSKEIWEYDMTTNAWTQKANFPGAQRASCFSFSIGNMGYVGGGDTLSGGLNSVRDFWQYNSQTDTWSQLTDYPGTRVTGSMGFSIQNTGFVFESGYGTLSAPLMAISQFRVWSFNPQGNSWTQKASLSMTPGKIATSASIFTLNDKAYASIGGNDTTIVNGQLQKKDFWEYNPQSDAWTIKPQVGGPVRWFPVSFAVNGKGYVGIGTGTMASVNRSDFWQYNQ